MPVDRTPTPSSPVNRDNRLGPDRASILGMHATLNTTPAQFGIFYGSARAVKQTFASAAEAESYRVKRFGRLTGHYVAAEYDPMAHAIEILDPFQWGDDDTCTFAYSDNQDAPLGELQAEFADIDVSRTY